MFPADPLPLAVELDLNGTWTDVTSYVYRRDMARITRGRSSDGTQVDRGTLNLTLNNRDGRFSSRNPTSPYYGVIGRNTPIRVAVESGDIGLLVPRDGRATTPDANALDITGDLDIRIELELEDWRSNAGLAGKFTTSGNQRSWAWGIDPTSVYLLWSTTGGNELLAASTVAPPVPASGRMALRVTLDVNNGASGCTVTFYYADTIAGPWTQLGSPATGAATSVFASTAVLQVGDCQDLGAGAIDGRVYAFELRNGINGSAVANPVFTAQATGTTSFADAAGRTWTVVSPAMLSNRRYRFHGEVSSWPQRWDTTGTDVYTPIEASGILRRLGQGQPVLGSALYRGRVRGPSLVAYWPFEDAEGSTSMAPALNHPEMTIIGSPTLATFEGFVASNPLPVLNGAEMRGACPSYTDTGQTQVRFVLAVPSGGAEDGQVLVMWYTTGSVRRWEVFYGTGGTMGLRAFDGGGVDLFTTGAVNFAVNGELLLVSIELTQNGANIDYALATVEPGATSGLASTGTLNANTVGRVGTVTVSPAGGITSVTIGHVSVQNAVTSVFDEGGPLAGWDGEMAGRRIERLCDEEGITFRGIGDLDDTVRMGAQRPARLLDLVRESADADAGMLYEPRHVLGIGYRTRVSLYNQAAAVALDYAGAELAGSLEPTDDDQAVMNDVTVTREGGSSARAVQETGALSVLPPPDGVGRYESTVTVNVQWDLDLFEQAGWRLHLGTVDEARYPQITVNLARPQIYGDAALMATVVAADVGDQVTIANPPAWLPPEAIAQLVQGYSEDLANFEWGITWNCSPASPYEVAVYDGVDRYGPSSTVTAEVLDTTETGVDITTPTGPLWTTAPGGSFDIVIGGERMTVTAVGAATGTAQTLTVIRSVNGVVKSHQTGAEVRMAEPAIYAL